MDKLMAMDALVIFTAGAGIIIVSLFAVVVLWNIYKGRIDLKYLLSEKNGQASLSRFQFLVFTFVIGFALIYVTLKNGILPDVGASVMALLGISGGTYAVSKGIQNSNEQADAEIKAMGETDAKSGGWKVKS